MSVHHRLGQSSWHLSHTPNLLTLHNLFLSLSYVPSVSLLASSTEVHSCHQVLVSRLTTADTLFAPPPLILDWHCAQPAAQPTRGTVLTAPNSFRYTTIVCTLRSPTAQPTGGREVSAHKSFEYNTSWCPLRYGIRKYMVNDQGVPCLTRPNISSWRWSCIQDCRWSSMTLSAHDMGHKGSMLKHLHVWHF